MASPTSVARFTEVTVYCSLPYSSQVNEKPHKLSLPWVTLHAAKRNIAVDALEAPHLLDLLISAVLRSSEACVMSGVKKGIASSP